MVVAEIEHPRTRYLEQARLAEPAVGDVALQQARAMVRLVDCMAGIGHGQLRRQERRRLIAVAKRWHAALQRVSTGRTETPLEPAKPAVSVKKSMTPDYLVCLEDGKRFKSLKRHLRTQYNMTPEQYRDKWSLPADYPMVAPNYAVARSQLAKKMGLGQQRRRRK